MTLAEFIKDQPELIKELEELNSTNKEGAERVNFLEREAKDAYKARDEAKAKLLDNGSDEAQKAEIANLKEVIANSEAELNGVRSESEATLNAMRMSNAISAAGVDAQNSDALEAITSLVLDGATYDDGFTWQNDDGTTRHNEANKPYGIIDKINEIKDGSKSYLFKTNGGGGGSGEPPKTEEKPGGISAIIDAGLTY